MDINYWSVLIAAIIYYIIGAIWYSPRVLGETWRELAGISSGKKEGMFQKYVLAFIGALVAVFVMAHYMEYTTSFTGVGGIIGGVQTGFWAWLGFAGATYLITHLFEDKPFKLFLINSGYHLTGLIVSGMILGISK